MDLIRNRTARFFKNQGRRPRILITRIHPTSSERDVKTIATAFADMGFDVDINTTVQSPTDLLRLALENDVHTVGIPGISADDRTQISELITIFNTKYSGSMLLAFWFHHQPHGTVGLPKTETVRIEIFNFDIDTTDCANRILDVLEQRP
jgi:methylmalonyl-CoA mutase